LERSAPCRHMLGPARTRNARVTMNKNARLKAAMHVTAHAVVAARGGRRPFPSFPQPTIPTLAWVMCVMPVTGTYTCTVTVNECQVRAAVGRMGWRCYPPTPTPPPPPPRPGGRFPPIRKSTSSSTVYRKSQLMKSAGVTYYARWHAMLIATSRSCSMHPLVMVKGFHTRTRALITARSDEQLALLHNALTTGPGRSNKPTTLLCAVAYWTPWVNFPPGVSGRPAAAAAGITGTAASAL
jgi:hypothetical protein